MHLSRSLRSSTRVCNSGLSRAQEHGSELASSTAELLKKVEVVRKEREEGENYRRAHRPSRL